ncbi:MAG: hypothetical protein JOZ80_01345 [Acidobacteriaceae bacterium]|nr:hypothetical protein [Acidobacteriaceae bacterium]
MGRFQLKEKLLRSAEMTESIFYNAGMVVQVVRTLVSATFLLLVLQVCAAEDAARTSAQADKVSGTSSEVQPPPAHRFWDRENILLFSGVAFTRGMDYASTRNFQARGRKEILLPQDVVNNSAAFASIEAAGTITSVGSSYIFHRTGHHTLERWMSIGHISVTAFGDIRNYSLKSKHH